MPLIIPENLFRRRRPAETIATPVPPVVALELQSATIVSSSAEELIVTLLFDNDSSDPLAAFPSGVAGRWAAILDGGRYVGTTMVPVGYDSATLTLVLEGEGEGPDGVSYVAGTGDPFETDSGRVLYPFVNFPFAE